MKVIETERLILRTWENEDANEYYRINQDPKVIEFLQGPLTMKEVTDFISFVNKQFEEIGYTVWAAQEKSSGKLIGYIGLDPIKWNPPFGKAVEVEWRLGSEYWNKGYATEGAKACLDYGFNQCGLKEIVSFTVPMNSRSIRVMEKIGMIRDLNGDFAHPKLPPDHRLSKHILYRIKNKN
ncbi:TPA: GNAT family N-acetyltransferase [Legionella pneumophila]|nr:GNAT family N-acetyltransferase [Legionella pneumophila]HAU0297536.1 GNAT family N-acetyltransferase [Legionella pneumophila]